MGTSNSKPKFLKRINEEWVEVDYRTHLRYVAKMLDIPHTTETDRFIDDLFRKDFVSSDQDFEALKQYAEYLRVRGNPALIAASRLTNPELLAPFEDQLKESLNEIPR